MEQTNERIAARWQDMIEVKEKWECIRKCISKTADEQLGTIQKRYRKEWWKKT